MTETNREYLKNLSHIFSNFIVEYAKLQFIYLKMKKKEFKSNSKILNYSMRTI